jgi:hypothetical protein
VTIASPANNSTYLQGATITFSGSASDAQDGNLSASLLWTSSRDGVLGVGALFSRTLSVGTHVITVSATDLGSLVTYRQVTTTVTATAQSSPAPAPSSVTLTARGYKVRGLHRVDLAWSGLSGSAVDVYRNGSRITTLRAGAASWTDAMNTRGGASYSYRVCAAGGTSTCSNTAQVVF